ncbi:response regulator [Saccharospirillum salsuginis]|uniref:Two-component system response regulator n=1 Tax=Saccharospirillum salsuginis TaxID=418750 RepID=A0A918KLC8_9GAMM|nr:response regulator [Saccharospirillum salsuginis]GGX67829.1 two-component system response regulator [Saccharospirillum salsuginis]
MQKLNFLVADDAGFIRDLVKRALKSQFTQCQIDEAINGRKAQSLMSRNRYDLILCDWEMPEMSGLEVLEWCRSREAEEGLDKTPFIMVTSRGDKSHVVKAVEAGVNDYIGKPFSNDQFLKKVFKALSVNHRELIRSILKGRSAMAGKPSSGLGGDSASLLTGGRAEPSTAPSRPAASSDTASLLTAGSPSSKLSQKSPDKSAARKYQSKVMLRSPKANWSGQVRKLTLTEIVVRITFDEVPPPGLLDQVVVDLQVSDSVEDIARINGFITQLALQEASLDCRAASISVKFVDDDPDKMAILSRLVTGNG